MARISARLCVVMLAVALPWLAAAEAAGPIELLTAVERGFEAGTLGWASSPSAPPAPATLAVSASPASHSGAALWLTAGTASTFSAATQYWLVQTVPGATHTLSAWLYDNDAKTVDVTLRLAFLSGDGVVLSAGSFEAPSLSGDLPAFRPVTLAPATSPPGTAFARVTIAATASAAGATLGIDDVSLLREEPPPTSSPTPTPTPTATAAATTTATTTATPQATATATAAATSQRASAPAPPPSASLVNSGFESGLASWERAGGFATLLAQGLGSGGAAELSSRTDSTKWLHQAVTVAPGRYAVSARLRLTGAAGAGWLRVAWYASAVGEGPQLATVDSPLLIVTDETREVRLGPVAAPSGARSARVRIMLRPLGPEYASIIADDVRFELSTEPVLPPQLTPVAAPLATPLPTPRAVSSPAAGAAVAQVAAVPTIEPRVETTGSSATTRPAPDGGAAGVAVVSAAGQGTGAARAARASLPTPTAVLPGVGDPGVLLRITELMPDPVEPGVDAEYEWIEIANLGTRPAALGGLLLADNAGAIELPAVTLSAGGVLVVAGARAQVPEDVAFWPPGGFSNGLGNGGDRLVLYRADGAVIDALSYGSDATYDRPPLLAPGSGRSLMRTFADDGTLLAAEVSGSPSPGVLTAQPTSDRAGAAGVVSASIARPRGGAIDSLGWAALGAIGVGGVGAAIVQRYRVARRRDGGERS